MVKNLVSSSLDSPIILVKSHPNNSASQSTDSSPSSLPTISSPPPNNNVSASHIPSISVHEHATSQSSSTSSASPPPPPRKSWRCRRSRAATVEVVADVVGVVEVVDVVAGAVEDLVVSPSVEVAVACLASFLQSTG
ncbi:hypothetical protein LWI29_012269 [Acer saccharum]|uniref:Uncharacterized protein n=1 Tax=Acer saccharum TaxID=4024 RepID=A0AA39RX11_ACESA|nr:hypothetical protein LWI29_012269 [Acer saccharum]